ncbi:TPA_asm: P3 protein [Foeniculum vulgare polerovirus]|nr:TPA_asm: P3 protein [Foeniculum vulgare polerovirus]
MAIYGLTKRADRWQPNKPMVVVNQPARRPRRRVRTKPVVVVQTAQPGRRRRRRGRRNRNNARANAGSGNGGGSQSFVFSKDDITGNSDGALTFGKDLSEHAAFSSGILLAFHEYKITNVRVIFKSEAPSTAFGSLAIEMDPHCKLSKLQSKIFKFGITRGGQKAWSSQAINGQEWHPSDENQFRILWKGNSDSKVIGSFEIHYTVKYQNPK